MVDNYIGHLLKGDRVFCAGLGWGELSFHRDGDAWFSAEIKATGFKVDLSGRHANEEHPIVFESPLLCAEYYKRYSEEVVTEEEWPEQTYYYRPYVRHVEGFIERTNLLINKEGLGTCGTVRAINLELAIVDWGAPVARGVVDENKEIIPETFKIICGTETLSDEALEEIKNSWRRAYTGSKPESEGLI